MGLINRFEASCACCPAQLQLEACGDDPEPARQELVASGWSIDDSNPEVVLCPDCSSPPEPPLEFTAWLHMDADQAQELAEKHGLDSVRQETLRMALHAVEAVVDLNTGRILRVNGKMLV